MEKSAQKPWSNAFRKPVYVVPILLLVTVIPWLYIYANPERNGVIFTTQYSGEGNSLERILEKAAMPDKMVIFTTSNEAWSAPDSILDMFLGTMRRGNGTNIYIDHLVILTVDGQAYERCKLVHRHCYELIVSNSTHEEALYMTPTYLNILWKRTAFLLEVLKLGYSFVSSDADVLWLQDPFPRFFPDADIIVSSDTFKGSPDDMSSLANTGFYLTRSNNRTIQFFKYFLEAGIRYPKMKEQDVFDAIKTDANTMKMGLRIKFLDTLYFGGFCHPSNNFNLVCTMHANCCISLKSKIQDLTLVIEDWFSFYSLTPAEKANMTVFKFRSPRFCRM